jgi:hypothetical protein
MTAARHDLTVAELATKLRGKEVSAVEAAPAFPGRGAQHANLGAYLDVRRRRHPGTGPAADARIARRHAPLLGRAHCAQGHLRHQGLCEHGRLEDAGRLPLAFRRTVVDKLAPQAP